MPPTLVDFRKPKDCFILESCVSYSGKYWGFFGTHYHNGKPCWCVGVSNKSTGEIIMRHYNGDNNVNDTAAKVGATKEWETFREGLERRPEASEEDDATSELSAWFDRANKAYGHIGSACVAPAKPTKPN